MSRYYVTIMFARYYSNTLQLSLRLRIFFINVTLVLQDASDPCCNITVCDDPILDPGLNVDKEQQKQPRIFNLPSTTGCLYKDKLYEFESEFYDGCESFCFCTETGETLCNPIKCPSQFGLDVINPFCLEWEKHDNFVAEAPMCCPPVPTCKSDGSCEYDGGDCCDENVDTNMAHYVSVYSFNQQCKL